MRYAIFDNEKRPNLLDRGFVPDKTLHDNWATLHWFVDLLSSYERPVARIEYSPGNNSVDTLKAWLR